MDNLLLYLLKVSAGTTLLYLCYLLLFRKDTFYLRNRVFLILILLLPAFFPALNIPVVTTPVAPAEIIPSDIFSFTEASAATVVSGAVKSFDYNRLFTVIYFVVAGLLLLRVVISLVSTYSIIRKGTISEKKFPKVVISDNQLPPFSFFPYAVIPTEEFKTGNYSDLLDHEFAHIRQGHTFDLILSEIIIAFQWFNPFIWIIKRSIVLNHEYLADHVSLSNKCVKEYQYRLLNFQPGLRHISLAHNFNSLIKNRIIMINKKPTRKYAAFKSIIILPVVAFLAYSFATPVYTSTGNEVQSENIINNQANEVKGIVLQQDKLPVSEAIILVKGTSLHFTTYKDGTFILPYVPENSFLTVSHAGYKTKEIKAVFTSSMTIILEKAEPENSNPNQPYVEVEQMPQYPGGETGMQNFITRSMKYPEAARAQKIDGRVLLRFVVNTEGNVQDIKILKGLHPSIDTEALRVVGMLNGFTPGYQEGKPVNVYKMVTLTFSLDKTEKLFTKTSETDILKFVGMNTGYPQEAKAASDTGSIYVVLKLQKGGTVKNSKVFTDKKDVKAPFLPEVVIVGYKPSAGQITTEAVNPSGKDHPLLKAEALRVVNNLTVTEIPDWADKDLEFAIAIKFILK